MFKLMKLEWKHKLSRYFKSVAICIIAIAAVSLMALGMKAEENMLFSDFTEHGAANILLG